jgi:hypothetical protein
VRRSPYNAGCRQGPALANPSFSFESQGMIFASHDETFELLDERFELLDERFELLDMILEGQCIKTAIFGVNFH